MDVKNFAVAMHQSQYLPWLGYLEKIDFADTFVIVDNVQLKKTEWQTRNRIKTSLGWQWLTLPVAGKFPINIENARVLRKSFWLNKHLRKIKHHYQKSAHFSKYFTEFSDVLKEAPENLSDFNVFVLKWLMSAYGIKTPIVFSKEFSTSTHPTRRLIDLCERLNANIFLVGSGGTSYIDSDMFNYNSNVALRIQRYKHPTYKQAKSKSEFMSHMSSLDLLFNEGKNSLEILRSGRNWEIYPGSIR